MLTIRLALRNIFSHLQRSAVIFIVIAVVTAILFLILCFSDATIENFRKGLLDIDEPECHIVAFQKGFQERRVRGEELTSDVIENYKELRANLFNFDFIQSVYQNTFTIGGSIFFRNKKIDGFLYKGMERGYDEHILSKIDVVEGDLFQEIDEYAMLLNIQSKEGLKAEPGDTLTVIGKDISGQAVAQDFTLSGYFKLRIDNLNLSQLAYVDMKGHYIISGFFDNEAFS